MTGDMTEGNDKPTWPLSSYGPAKHVPTLVGGLDESPEEQVRIRLSEAVDMGRLPLNAQLCDLRFDESSNLAYGWARTRSEILVCTSPTELWLKELKAWSSAL